MAHNFLRDDGRFFGVNSADLGYSTTTTTAILTSITAAQTTIVIMPNTGTHYIGPSVAQGSSGIWFVHGTVTLKSTGGGGDQMNCVLWDGTTTIASASCNLEPNFVQAVSLAGVLASPAGNLSITVQDQTSTNGQILPNNSGSAKDSSITAIRIG